MFSPFFNSLTCSSLGGLPPHIQGDPSLVQKRVIRFALENWMDPFLLSREYPPLCDCQPGESLKCYWGWQLVSRNAIFHLSHRLFCVESPTNKSTWCSSLVNDFTKVVFGWITICQHGPAKRRADEWCHGKNWWSPSPLPPFGPDESWIGFRAVAIEIAIAQVNQNDVKRSSHRELSLVAGWCPPVVSDIFPEKRAMMTDF